jgi:hypothetical protein
MIRKNRETEQIDTKLGAELLEILFNPKLAMVEVLTGAFVLSHEKTLANGPIANVSDDDFVGINRFTTSQTYHGRTASGLKEIRGDAIRRISIPPPHSRQRQHLKNALSLRFADVRDGISVATAEVPLAETFGYATDLRSMTQGQGTFTMEFCKYSQVPSNIQQDIIEAKRKAQLVGAK